MTVGIFSTISVEKNATDGVSISEFKSIDADINKTNGIVIYGFKAIDVIELSSFPNLGYFGIFSVVEKVCIESEAVALKYFMSAWDADGSQYVYWETEDQYLYPVTTQPVAVGTLTDFRIQAKRIA